MLLPTYRQSRMAVMPPFMPRGRLSFGSISGFEPTSVKFFIWPPDGILSTAVRGWTPVYSVLGCEQAAATRTATGARSSHLPKREGARGRSAMPFPSPVKRWRGRPRHPLTSRAVLRRPGLVRRARLEAGRDDVRVVRDAEARLRELVRVGTGVLEHVDPRVLVVVDDVAVHEDRVAPCEDVGRKQLLHTDRHAFGVQLGLVARAGGPLGAVADLGHRLVEEVAELERRGWVGDVDGPKTGAVPGREEHAWERERVVDGLGAAHDVGAVDAGRRRRRRDLVTLPGATVGVLLGARERPDVARIEISTEHADRTGAARSEELAGLAVVGREGVLVADVRERDPAERAGVAFVLDGHVRPAGDAHHSVDVRHFRAERRERLEVRKNAQAVTRLGLALRRRGVARAALGERRAVDLQVAVLGLREVHPATVERPGHVVGLGVVDPGAALVLRRDVRGDAELGAQAPLARELGVGRLRAAGEIPDADVDAVLGDTAVVRHRDEDAVRLVRIAPEGHVVEERVLDVDLGDDRGLLAVGRVIDTEHDVRVARRRI